jgi:hypothetical protein
VCVTSRKRKRFKKFLPKLLPKFPSKKKNFAEHEKQHKKWNVSTSITMYFSDISEAGKNFCKIYCDISICKYFFESLNSCKNFFVLSSIYNSKVYP